MRFNLITNLTNGAGLQKDFELLRAELLERGHQVHGIQFNSPVVAIADVNIFLETVVPKLFNYAALQWAIPNPEWWFEGWSQCKWDLVLAKTRDCERIFRKIVGDKCQFLGWTATDIGEPGNVRTRTFLHVTGKSKFKNTRAVIEGCRMANIPVLVIGNHSGGKWVTDAEIKMLMNRHQFHLMPSMYEGYGQVLHEAMSAEQVIITTDAPPMNEIGPVILVPSAGGRPHHAGILHTVTPLAIHVAVRLALQLSAEQIAWHRFGVREQYEREERQFRLNLNDVLKEAEL